ncbi:hypothetical protein AC578_5295 [Pseudocercospora eumusae]|uniref:Carboxypeptidase n=1 Tax=Pseudocercospora eumusae TaxID=321146 RepID=A0A139H022_9PEZI|nr:hypothetical protein AC578_5295 [Pseudocercospora eumusae]
MIFQKAFAAAACLLSTASLTSASLGPRFHIHSKQEHVKRQYYPKEASNVTTITTPTGVKIRYREPGKEGVCETTEGVNSYSGYVDVAPNVHVFFWFFESRRDPAADDFTLWLNGGPGSDSLIGLFEELGPCRISENLTSYLNPYSWNEVSNMLFLSQPVGVGFSNQGEGEGVYTNYTGTFLNVSQAEQAGYTKDDLARWPLLDPLYKGEIDTTELAAAAAWQVFQGFLSGLPQLEGNKATSPKKFNLWTESYGGHYGPAFFDYFYNQNQHIKNGSISGYEFDFNNLGIINGIIDERIQAEYYPEFAVNNTYGIKLYNDTVYNYARFATFMPNGCYDQIDTCVAAAQDVLGGFESGLITNAALKYPAVSGLCAEAGNMCRDNVEGVFYSFGDRGTYDIRHPSDDPTPEGYFRDYLNQAEIQDAIGVDLNYTTSNGDIYYNFQDTGDFIFPNFMRHLENILASGVRVTLAYGDADYICNWFGGQAISLAVNYVHSKEFRAAGYAPFLWSDANLQAGEVREYGNFSFIRLYDAGHEIPYYQPGPSLAIFNRSISGVNMADGTEKVTANLTTTGNANTTHTHSLIPLPPTESAAFASWSASIIASYSSYDQAAEPTAAPARYDSMHE